MANRKNRNKKPKAKGNKSQGVTRYASFLDIGQIDDGIIYGNNSTQALALRKIEQPPEFGAFGIEGFGEREYLANSSESFEWEFGKNAIAVTDDLIGSYLLKDFGDDEKIGQTARSHFRHVLEGSFTYTKKGALAHSVVNGFAIWQQDAEGKQSVMYTQFENPVEFDTTSFQDFTNRVTAEQAASATKNNGHTFFYEFDAGFETIGNLSDFNKFPISQYFGTNWWDNPFGIDIT